MLEFSSYSPVKFVFFLKNRLFFNEFYCFWLFVNKHFANLTGKKIENWNFQGVTFIWTRT